MNINLRHPHFMIWGDIIHVEEWKQIKQIPPTRPCSRLIWVRGGLFKIVFRGQSDFQGGNSSLQIPWGPE